MPSLKPDLWHRCYAQASNRCQATGSSNDFTPTGPTAADHCLYPVGAKKAIHVPAARAHAATMPGIAGDDEQPGAACRWTAGPLGS